MNAMNILDNDTYEKLAVSLAELIDNISADDEAELHGLLSLAYQTAYRKAAEFSAG